MVTDVSIFATTTKEVTSAPVVMAMSLIVTTKHVLVSLNSIYT